MRLYKFNGGVCYGEVLIYVIVANFALAMVKPFKVTDKSVLEGDEEPESHTILKKYTQQRGFKETLATHIKLVDLSDAFHKRFRWAT